MSALHADKVWWGMNTRLEKIEARVNKAERGEYYGNYRLACDDTKYLLALARSLEAEVNELRHALSYANVNTDKLRAIEAKADAIARQREEGLG